MQNSPSNSFEAHRKVHPLRGHTPSGLVPSGCHQVDSPSVHRNGLSYRQTTGIEITPLGRDQQPLGESERIIYPSVTPRHPKRKKNEYHTFFEARNHGKFRFQKNYRTGMFGLNYLAKRTFDFFEFDKNFEAKLLAYSIMTFLLNKGIRIEPEDEFAYRLDFKDKEAKIQFAFYLNEFREKYRARRKAYLLSLRRHRHQSKPYKK